MRILLKAVLRTVVIRDFASRILGQPVNGRRQATFAPSACHARSCDQVEAIGANSVIGLCEYSGWLIAAIEASGRDERER